MQNQQELPKSEAEAIAQGFKKIDNIETFLRDRLHISMDQFKEHRKAFSPNAQPVDCKTAPTNTQCFNRCYPDGTLVFGLCGANKSCVYFQGTCAPH